MKKSKTILRRQAVEKRTGRSCSSIYADIKKGEFPPPISIGERAVGWLESDINRWIESRITASQAGGKNV